MEEDIFADLLPITAIKQTKSAATSAVVPIGSSSPSAPGDGLRPTIAQPSVLERPTESAGNVPDRNGHTHDVPALSKADMEQIIQTAVAAAVESNLAKVMKSLRTVLEGLTKRIEHTGSSCAGLQRSVDSLKEAYEGQAENIHARFTNVDLAVKEVERGIQALRDKQELLEAQAALAQLTAKSASNTPKSVADQTEGVTSVIVPPTAPVVPGKVEMPLALAATVAAASFGHPSAHTVPAGAQFSGQQPPPSPAPGPSVAPTVQAGVVATTHPPATSSTAQDAYLQPSQFAYAPQPQPFSAPPPAEQYQYSSYTTSAHSVPTSLAPPRTPALGPPVSPAPVPMPPPPAPVPPPLAAPPLPPPAQRPAYPSGPTYPPPPGAGYPQFRSVAAPPPTLPTNPSQSGSRTSARSVPLDQIIFDISNMGFDRAQIRSVIDSLQQSGQSIDLNIILDRLMKG